MKCLNTIYFHKNYGRYFFDFQSQAIFKTNFFFKMRIKKKEDSNCIFPFRNFKNEFANLENSYFIIII